MARAQLTTGARRQVGLSDQPCPDCIQNVVVHVRDGVGRLDHLALERSWNSPTFREDVIPGLTRLLDGVEDLEAEIEALAAILKLVQHPGRLVVVTKTLWQA